MAITKRMLYGSATLAVLAAAVLALALTVGLRAQGEEGSCDLVGVHYDKVMTTQGGGITLKAEYRYAGHDYTFHETRRDSDDALLYQAEWVAMNRIMYKRTGTDDDPSTYGGWEVVGTHINLPPPPPCVDPDTLPEDLSVDSAEPHYVVESRPDVEAYTSTREDYWFTPETGYPARMRRTHFERDTTNVTGHVDTVYSDYGVENSITAPVVAPTPTPMATPPAPIVSVKTVAGDKWEFSWRNGAGLDFIAQLRRTDGRWKGPEVWRSGSSVTMPFDRPFQRAVHYEFAISLLGDGKNFHGEGPQATVRLYESIPPCRVGMARNPFPEKRYWEQSQISDWQILGSYWIKRQAEYRIDREVELYGCLEVSDREGPPHGPWAVYKFR